MFMLHMLKTKLNLVNLAESHNQTVWTVVPKWQPSLNTSPTVGSRIKKGSGRTPIGEGHTAFQS